MYASSIDFEKQFSNSVTESYTLTKGCQFTNLQTLGTINSGKHPTVLLLNSTITKSFYVLHFANRVTLVKSLKFLGLSSNPQ